MVTSPDNPDKRDFSADPLFSQHNLLLLSSIYHATGSGVRPLRACLFDDLTAADSDTPEPQIAYLHSMANQVDGMYRTLCALT